MTNAYRYLQQNGGLMQTKDYGRYENSQGQCRYEPEKQKVRVKDFHLIAQDEAAIQEELVSYGPVAVGINAQFLQLYTAGIHNPEKCTN